MKEKAIFWKKETQRKAKKFNMFQIIAKILLVKDKKQEEKDNIHVRGPSLTIKITYWARLKGASGLKKRLFFVYA